METFLQYFLELENEDDRIFFTGEGMPIDFKFFLDCIGVPTVDRRTGSIWLGWWESVGLVLWWEKSGRTIWLILHCTS